LCLAWGDLRALVSFDFDLGNNGEKTEIEKLCYNGVLLFLVSFGLVGFFGLEHPYT